MRLIALLLALLLSAAQAGTVREGAVRSKQLGRALPYTVYLPDGYGEGRLRYPVFYLLHGMGGNQHSWTAAGDIGRIADELIAAKAIPPTLIVMPAAESTWYVDRKERMESAFIQDLIPAIDAEYRTVRSRKGRVLAGYSMGGYGSLRFALKFPDVFAAAALLSPAIYDPLPPPISAANSVGVFGADSFDARVWRELNWPSLLPGFLARRLEVPIYIVTGDDDAYGVELHVSKLYGRLREAGQPAELRIVDGGHSWDVWRSTIGEAMRYIFSFASPAVSAP